MKKIKIITGVLLVIVGMLVMISGYINEKALQETNTTTNEIQNTTKNSTPSTNTTTTKKTTKKVVKTTKKTTKKKIQKFNIKYNKQEVIDYIHQEVVRRWGEEQWEATYQLIMHESGFNPNSVNKSSGACGIFQANPCSKVIKHGYTKYYTDWKEQVRWGLDWITVHKNYGTPKKAWAYWKKHGNY